MGVYKHKGPDGEERWCADFSYRDERKRYSFDTKKEAEDRYGEERRAARTSNAGLLGQLRGKPIPFSEWARECYRNHYAEKACASWAEIVIERHLIPFFKKRGDRAIQEIDAGDVRAYLASRSKMAPATRANERAVLSKLMSLAEDSNKIAVNPVKKVKKPKVENQCERYLSAEELAGLQKVVANNARIRAMIAVLIYSMGRRREALGLRWRNVDWLLGRITFGGKDTKNKKPRSVPMNEALRTALEEWKSSPENKHTRPDDYILGYRGKRIKSARTALQNALGEAGIKNFRPHHDLRHTGASWQVMADGNLYALQQLLGHKDAKTTQRYAHLSPDYLKSEAEKIRPPAATPQVLPHKLEIMIV